jgi:hypothetical protein
VPSKRKGKYEKAYDKLLKVTEPPGVTASTLGEIIRQRYTADFVIQMQSLNMFKIDVLKSVIGEGGYFHVSEDK